MIKSISSLNTISIPKNLSFKSDSIKNPETDSNKMDTKTKVLIGACALATIAIAGICIAKRGKIKNTHIKPEAPEVKPPEIKPVDIKPEIKPQTPEIKPTKTDAPEVPVEKPTAPIEVAKTEFQLFEEATSIDEFRKIGKFEKGKAVLNNGEPFNGNIAVKRTGKQKHKPILLEYKDGVITKSTTFKFKKPDIVRKYENGEISEIIEEGDLLTKYSRDKNGNRVITEIKGSETAYPKEKITTITKENDAVVKTCSSGAKTVYSKDRKVREFNHYAKTNLLCREVTDKKTGKTTRYFVNKESEEVEELIPFEITKPAKNGLPAYKYSYDGNFQKSKFLEVLNADGSLKFQTGVYDYNFLPQNTPSNKVYYYLDNNLLDSAELIHDLETGTNRIPFKDVNVYMDAQNPDVILFVGNKNNLSGSYNIKTKEIDGGYYNMQDRIKKILNNIFGNREPINIDKLYEEMNNDLTSILKEIK